MLNNNYLRFVVGFLAIIAVVGSGFFVWNRYLSPQAKINRETQANYQKYLDWEEQYKKAMREDTYGGKTPQETLDLFVKALQAEDIELASKYFVLDTNEQPYNAENYLTRKKVVKALVDEKQKDRLQYIADVVSRAIPDLSGSIHDGDYGFVVYEEGEILTEINMELNKYSNVWKIESL
jgi:hypothetical protein